MAASNPYILAIIKLLEGPHITSQIIDSQNVNIGDSVESVFRKLSVDGNDGVIKYGYKFKLIAKN